MPQDDAVATYAGKIRRQDAAIDWDGDAADIHRRIRAYNPVPGAWFDLDGDSIKCWKAEVAEGLPGHSGKILEAGKTGIVVACRTGALRLLELQRPGRKRVTGAEFAAQANLVGKRFG
jgi:methionyl-tRNA formyltransferase